MLCSVLRSALGDLRLFISAGVVMAYDGNRLDAVGFGDNNLHGVLTRYVMKVDFSYWVLMPVDKAKEERTSSIQVQPFFPLTIVCRNRIWLILLFVEE